MHYVLVNLREPNSLHNLALLNMARGRRCNVILLDPLEKKIGLVGNPHLPSASETQAFLPNSQLFAYLRSISEAGNDSSIRGTFLTQHPAANNGLPATTYFYVNVTTKKFTSTPFSNYGLLTSDEVKSLVQAQVLNQLNNNPSRSPELVKGILHYQNLLTKDLSLQPAPTPSPYSEHYYYNFSITSYSGITYDYNPTLSLLKNMLSHDDFVRYLTWSIPEEIYSAPRGSAPVLPPTMIFKPANPSYWSEALHHSFSIFHDGFFYTAANDTNAFTAVRDNTSSAPFIFLVKEFPENEHLFVSALLHHYWNAFRGQFAIRPDAPLGTGMNFKRSTFAAEDVSAVANEQAFKLLSKPFGILAASRWAQIPGHVVNTINNHPKSVNALQSLRSFEQALKERHSATENLDANTNVLSTRERDLERLLRTIKEQERNIESLKARIKEDQERLSKLVINFDSVNASIEEVLAVYSEHSFDLAASFNGLVTVLNKFNAYIHEVVFNEGVMTFDSKTKTYRYKGNNEPSPREYTFVEVFSLASIQFPRAIEICITKPFVNSFVDNGGVLSKAHSYILQPLRFKYDLMNGAGVLVGGGAFSFSHGSSPIKKAHPHLPNVNINDSDVDAYQYFSYRWLGSFPEGARVYEIGGEPCVGSLSSHVGAARNNKDFAHFVRASLAWCTSNAGLHDTWSAQCPGFDRKLTLEQVLSPQKDPMQNFRIDSVYFNGDAEEFYALLYDPDVQQRTEWAAQAAELNPVPSFVPYHLYKIPSTKKTETSFVLDFSSIQTTHHLGSTATNRIRRLAKAQRLPFETQLTKMKSRVTIEVIKAPAPAVGESESVDVPAP